MRRSRVKPTTVVKIAIVAFAALLYLAPLPQSWIERHYSETTYPAFQRIITPISDKFPFAVFDLLFIAAAVGLVVWWCVAIRRPGKGSRLKAVPGLFLNTLVFAAAGAVLFLLLWGLNYRRVPLETRLDYDRSRITLQSAQALAVQDVSSLNSLVKQAHESVAPSGGEWGGRIAPSFQEVVKGLGNERGIATATPKISLFNGYLSSTGVDGFTDPFALEVILNSHLLVVEEPFALAHEWAHLAGFADESEANFIALLACVRSDDPAVRYSGWLALYENLPARLVDKQLDVNRKAAGEGSNRSRDARSNSQPSERRKNSHDGQSERDQRDPQQGDELKLDPQVIADIAAIQERLRTSISPWLSSAETKVYDRYLKANRVEAGVASYGLFVRLVLGTRFTGNWSPVVKTP